MNQEEIWDESRRMIIYIYFIRIKTFAERKFLEEKKNNNKF